MVRSGEGEGLLFSDVIGDAGVDLIESAQEVEDEDGLRYPTSCSSSAFSFMRTQ
jgi:hypothetical protein